MAARGSKWCFAVASGNSQLQSATRSYGWRIMDVHSHSQLHMAARGIKWYFAVASGNSQLQSATRAYGWRIQMCITTRSCMWQLAAASGISQLQVATRRCSLQRALMTDTSQLRIRVSDRHITFAQARSQLLVAACGDVWWRVVASSNSQLQSATRAYGWHHGCA